MPYAMIYPMFAMVVLTMMVGALNLFTRITAVRSGRLDPGYFKTFSVGTPPEDVIKVGRHFNNLFEVPTLFYAGALAAMVTGTSGAANYWAWGFVATRVLHTFIHIGPNKLLYRMPAFVAGVVCLAALWVCVVCKVAFAN